MLNRFRSIIYVCVDVVCGVFTVIVDITKIIRRQSYPTVGSYTCIYSWFI